MAEISTIGLLIPGLTTGGAERVVAVLAEALSNDFAVHVLVQTGAEQHYLVPGVTLHEIDFTRDAILTTVERLKLDLILDHYHWDPAHVRLMAEIADAGIKVVLTEHNAYHYPLFQWARDTRFGARGWFEERLDFYRRFAAVTLLNTDAFAWFSQHLDNVCLIRNPAPTLASDGADPGSRRILTVSHFRKRAKRLDLMYQVFAKVRGQVPDAELTALGDYDWVQDQAFRKASGLDGVRIETPGRSLFVDRHYDRAALFALTSEIEGQPMVLLEAALHGLPQVAFDLPGLRDQVVHGETGLLVPFGDTEGFADAVSGLITDEARLARMGAAAREMVGRDFALAKVAEAWRGLIGEIAANGRVRSERAHLSADMSAREQVWTRHWQNIARLGDPTQVPKVSFLVPVHGTEEVLGRCLRSIQTQTLREFECLIVDDASPGDVGQIVRNTVGDDPRFRVITHAKNRGLYQARTTAAEAARGLYFAHVDSDDYIHEDFGAILFAEAITTGSEIVECKAVELQEDGRPIRFNEIRQEGPVDGDQAARAFFAGRLRNVVWNKLYDRDLWRRAPLHRSIDIGLTICEDMLRNSLLFPECRRYSSVKDCLYFYCRRPGSVVKGGDLQRLLAKLNDVERSYDLAKSQQALAERAANWHDLEARRIADVTWYVAEYLKRHDEAEVAEQLRRLGDKVSPGLVQTMVEVRAGLAQKESGQGRGGREKRR